METNFTEKLETLLKSKSYSSLSEIEKEYVLTLISKEEYELFFYALQDVVSSSLSDKKALKLDNDILPNLQRAFKEKHQPFYLKAIKLPYKTFQIPIYQVAAASLVFAIAIFSLMIQNENALQDESEFYLSEAEFNKYTQWDGFYSDMSDVSIEDELTQELMTMSVE